MTVTRSMMIVTATRRAAGVTVHELHRQTPSIVAAVVTRTSTVHRGPTATGARSIVVAIAPDHLVRETNMKTKKRTAMAKRILMAVHDASTGAGATAHATRNVNETARIVKSESETATMITTARRIAPATRIRTRTVGGVAIVKVKTMSVIMGTTITALHAVVAKIAIASDVSTMTMSAKTSHLNRRGKRMSSVR
jgi:hypothetical protein